VAAGEVCPIAGDAGDDEEGGDVFAVDETLSDDAVIAGRRGPAVAGHAAADLDAPHLLAVRDHPEHLGRGGITRLITFRRVDAAKPDVGRADGEGVAVRDRGDRADELAGGGGTGREEKTARKRNTLGVELACP